MHTALPAQSIHFLRNREIMPVSYSVRYLEQVDPFNSSSRSREDLVNLESDEILTPSEITSRVIQHMNPFGSWDVKMSSQSKCVEYGGVARYGGSSAEPEMKIIFNQGQIFSIVPNSSPKSVWEGRASLEHQDSHTIDFLDWWEKELEFVAIPSSIQDRATDTYTITIQFSDGIPSVDIGHHNKRCGEPFEDHVAYFLRLRYSLRRYCCVRRIGDAQSESILLTGALCDFPWDTFG
jgi:hypothetical protein